MACLYIVCVIINDAVNHLPHSSHTHTCALHVHVSCLTTYHTLLIHTHTHMYRDHPSIAHVRPTKSGNKRPHQNITVSSQVISPCRDVPTPASEHMLGYKRGKFVRLRIKNSHHLENCRHFTAITIDTAPGFCCSPVSFVLYSRCMCAGVVACTLCGGDWLVVSRLLRCNLVYLTCKPY